MMVTAATERRRPGRPRKYPVGAGQDGAPKLTLRMAPELFEWVQAQGGAEFVRQILLREQAHIQRPE
jgi:hypothetical protein